MGKISIKGHGERTFGRRGSMSKTEREMRGTFRRQLDAQLAFISSCSFKYFVSLFLCVSGFLCTTSEISILALKFYCLHGFLNLEENKNSLSVKINDVTLEGP